MVSKPANPEGWKEAKPPKLCVYCGARSATTKDHVIPKCLFPGPLPLNMVTVPVCNECNEAKSRDDDYLRDMLAMDLNTGEHPGAQTLLSGEVLRSMQTNRSLVARSAKANWKLEPLHTKGGIYLGHHPAFPLDGPRVERIFTNIVRGLYYRILKARIPDDYSFEVRRLDPLEVEPAWQDLKSLGPSGPYRLDEVFVCSFVHTQEDPFISYWLLGFYESIFVTVSTEPPEGVPSP